MGEPFPTYPKLYEEIPKAYHDPKARLAMLDADGVDAEVLFPNPPGGSFFEFGDVEFELDVVRAYNDALAEWYRASDRYLPLAIVPYLSSPEVIKLEIERAAAAGHRGVNLMGQMPKGTAAYHRSLLASALGCLSGVGSYRFIFMARPG